MEIPIWQYLVSMLTYIILLMLLVEVMRKYRKFAAVFWILSLLTFPLWFAQLEGWFRWVKVISVLVPTALIVGPARIANFDQLSGWWKIYRKDWVLWSLYGILGLNILEATVKDFALQNYLNGSVGVILILTMPLYKYIGKKANGWEISKEEPGDVLAYTDHIWNFLYTTWNIAFVYAENPGFAASSLSILLAAELYPVIKKRPELYITARIYTLAMHMLIRATYDIFTPIMDSTRFYNETIVHYWGLINLIIAIPYIFWYFHKRRQEFLKERKP
ncbi:MAG: hypothetical protein KFF49_03325 [Bacteroidales bacterium]|nr:hypothetical protein [Bacteroidales bacterium]